MSCILAEFVFIIFRYHLTNHKFVILKRVWWQLEVERGGTLSNAATYIVVRPVAWAKPTIVLSGAGNGNTAQVSADADDNEPSNYNNEHAAAAKQLVPITIWGQRLYLYHPAGREGIQYQQWLLWQSPRLCGGG